MIILQVPEDAKIHEMQNSIIWFDKNGILYSRPKSEKFIDQTREDILVEMAKFKEITGNKKVSMIVEAHPHAEAPKKEDRDFIADQLAEVTKAMALITSSAVSRMVANLFFLFKPAPYPMKMFTDVKDAQQWLNTCLAKSPGVHSF